MKKIVSMAALIGFALMVCGGCTTETSNQNKYPSHPGAVYSAPGIPVTGKNAGQ